MKKDRKPKLDYKGLPINPNDWTEADWRDLHDALEVIIKRVAARHKSPVVGCAKICVGYGGPAVGPPCCDRAGEYNGFDSGPTTFRCPKHCGCHD